MQTLLCNASNYAVATGRAIQYIVIHYTANNGDTAAGNASYFARTAGLQASAHYFVDETEIWQSVPDKDRAWHCGGTTYYHNACRNSNSIGIEICSRKDSNGRYYFSDAAVDNAVNLTRDLMAKYGIDAAHVIRHYDVTHKNCPAPFVEDPEQWAAFLKRLEGDENMTQDQFNAMMDNWLAGMADKPEPAWSRKEGAWAKATAAGIVNGKAPEGFVKRDEMVAVLSRLGAVK